MGFKADLSFLQKLTMGATATRAAVAFLEGLGFAPIELERYSTSNKIWSTKVKRLRLADLLCVRTGLRVEIRAKSDLQIKMSDSPTNLERRWDSGLRDEDLIGLVSCYGGAAVHVRAAPVFIAVRDLRATVHLAKVGQRKSASEGAERDITWPSIVPSGNGEVVEVTAERIRVRMDPGRFQSYKLKGKTPLVKVGDRFTGEASFLAGAVSRIINPTLMLSRRWSPVDDLRSDVATDRYAAAKALASGKADAPVNVVTLLANALECETEPRTALEIAGALARLGEDAGFEYLASSINREGDKSPGYLRMEAILILSEIPDARSATALDKVAGDRALKGDELRQAAVWGLGRFGIQHYSSVATYIADEEDDVALHAIAALGPDTDKTVIEVLADMLVQHSSSRTKAAASEALRIIGSLHVAEALIFRVNSGSPWVPATLGRLPMQVLANAKIPASLAQMIEPIRLLSSPSNWLAARNTVTDFQFLLQQDL
ncbi:HEAT repeat domain-containing protein [Chondromyces apiculatus]|uniref:HEAT repeat domain-containing protein n=1 Tax=Chondromyces apiculatus TaxID=51 RepID=UPI0012DED270|nr:HEAT repeat domain-containing protein [Chondromyces apiculatus]